MPNWTRNTLTITGKNLKAFKALIKKAGGFSFGLFLPCPKELTNQQSPFKRTPEEKKILVDKYGYADWYEWSLANWGCKWDVEELRETFQKDAIILDFDTPWSPPIQALQKISEMHPTLSFFLAYVGEDPYYGKATFENGRGEPEDMEEEEYYTEFDDDFRRELNAIHKMPYKEFLKEYAADPGFDEEGGDHPMCLLDKHILARIKDKDLPLFVTRHWWNCQDEFDQRLKGCFHGS